MKYWNPKRVLLLDHRSRRAKNISATLARKWDAETTTIESFEAAEPLIRSGDWPFDVLFVAFGRDHRRMLKACPADGTSRVLITDYERIRLPEDVPKPTYPVDISPEVAAHDQQLIRTLQPFMGDTPPRLAKLLPKNLPEALASQVRWLNSEGNLLDGKEILQQLIWQLDPAISQFQLFQIGQGFSGASVFRLGMIKRDDQETSKDLVLKLTPNEEHQSYKCRHEVDNHRKIKGSFNLGPVNHVPDLICPDGKPAECGGWLAVMYECLTHKELCVVDLEHVVLEPEKCAAELKKKKKVIQVDRLAEQTVANVIEALTWWYNSGKLKPAVKSLPLWAIDDAPVNLPPSFPPYRFTSWEKKNILETIDLLDSYGKSLPTADWEVSRAQVLRLVAADRDSSLPAAIITPRPVILSRVHGDLNANNVLIELISGLVLFIDFACFQERGHLAQDFARLEVAIKIELMGREAGGPDGRDLNTTEFSFWCDAERWLQSWPDSNAPEPASFVQSSSARHTFSLCALIRRSFEEIQVQLGGKSHGAKSESRLAYEAAVLYHTVRSIRFATRPHLKRIFAVYSARLLMERLESLLPQ